MYARLRKYLEAKLAARKASASQVATLEGRPLLEAVIQELQEMSTAAALRAVKTFMDGGNTEAAGMLLDEIIKDEAAEESASPAMEMEAAKKKNETPGTPGSPASPPQLVLTQHRLQRRNARGNDRHAGGQCFRYDARAALGDRRMA